MLTNFLGNAVKFSPTGTPITVNVVPTGGEVITGGSIIVRQRGTKFHVGFNVGKGKDDTLFAKITGTVKFEGPKERRRVSVYPIPQAAPAA